MAQQMRERDQMYAQQYQQAAATAKEPSEAEKQRESERKAYFEWKGKKDYRTPPPSLINLAMADPAAARAKREMEMSAVGTGIWGMGADSANPTAIAMNKQNLADTNEKAHAAAYEGDLRAEDMYQRTDNSGALMALDFARKMKLMDSTAGMSQFQTGARIQSQPQSILPMILSAAAGVGGAALGSYMGRA